LRKGIWSSFIDLGFRSSVGDILTERGIATDFGIEPKSSSTSSQIQGRIQKHFSAN
jgi:hypothetical protein